MNIPDVQIAIGKLRYKPGSTIELAPIEGRLLDPYAGPLRLIIRLTIVSAIEPRNIIVNTHKSELPAAQHIRDLDHLLSLIRNALRAAEAYETDQWFEYDGKNPYRGNKK